MNPSNDELFALSTLAQQAFNILAKWYGMPEDTKTSMLVHLGTYSNPVIKPGFMAWGDGVRGARWFDYVLCLPEQIPMIHKQYSLITMVRQRVLIPTPDARDTDYTTLHSTYHAAELRCQEKLQLLGLPAMWDYHARWVVNISDADRAKFAVKWGSNHKMKHNGGDVCNMDLAVMFRYARALESAVSLNSLCTFRQYYSIQQWLESLPKSERQLASYACLPETRSSIDPIDCSPTKLAQVMFWCSEYEACLRVCKTKEDDMPPTQMNRMAAISCFALNDLQSAEVYARKAISDTETVDLAAVADVARVLGCAGRYEEAWDLVQNNLNYALNWNVHHAVLVELLHNLHAPKAAAYWADILCIALNENVRQTMTYIRDSWYAPST